MDNRSFSYLASATAVVLIFGLTDSPLSVARELKDQKAQQIPALPKDGALKVPAKITKDVTKGNKELWFHDPKTAFYVSKSRSYPGYFFIWETGPGVICEIRSPFGKKIVGVPCAGNTLLLEGQAGTRYFEPEYKYFCLRCTKTINGIKHTVTDGIFFLELAY